MISLKLALLDWQVLVTDDTLEPPTPEELSSCQPRGLHLLQERIHALLNVDASGCCELLLYSAEPFYICFVRHYRRFT